MGLALLDMALVCVSYTSSFRIGGSRRSIGPSRFNMGSLGSVDIGQDVSISIYRVKTWTPQRPI